MRNESEVSGQKAAPQATSCIILLFQRFFSYSAIVSHSLSPSLSLF